MFEHMLWGGRAVASLVTNLGVPGEAGRVPNVLGDFLGEATSLVVSLASCLKREGFTFPVVGEIGGVNSMYFPGCAALQLKIGGSAVWLEHHSASPQDGIIWKSYLVAVWFLGRFFNFVSFP